MCTRLWELNVQNLVLLHSSRAVSYHSQQCVWCHNNFAWICVILSRTEIFLWMKYALVARWLYLATRKKNYEIWLIPGTRFLLIVFNLVNIRGVVQHKWLMVWCVQWYDISHSVKDRHSIQLGFASLNRTSIFHLMRNLVPLHGQPLAICILILFTLKAPLCYTWGASQSYLHHIKEFLIVQYWEVAQCS